MHGFCKLRVLPEETVCSAIKLPAKIVGLGLPRVLIRFITSSGDLREFSPCSEHYPSAWELVLEMLLYELFRLKMTFYYYLLYNCWEMKEEIVPFFSLEVEWATLRHFDVCLACFTPKQILFLCKFTLGCPFVHTANSMYLITRPPRDFDFIYSERQREAERGHEREGMRGREWGEAGSGWWRQRHKESVGERGGARKKDQKKKWRG